MGVPTKPPSFRTVRLPVVQKTREAVYLMGRGREFFDDDGYGGVYAGATGSARLLEDGSQRLDEDEGVRLCE